MCAATVAPVRAIRVDESLDAVLIATHDAWAEEARRHLLPATVPDVATWDRWSMVRYLNEGFLERFNVERALVRALQPVVPARARTCWKRPRLGSPSCTWPSTESVGRPLPLPSSRR